VRQRLGALLLVLVVEGCAAAATSDGAARKLPLPLGELLLVGFGGTQVEGGAAERVIAGIRQALRDGRLSPKALAMSIERVRALRSRIAQ